MTSEEEEKLVETFLHSGISYWIGLSDIFHEGISKEDISYTRSFSGVYRWQESHQEAQYTNWAPGKPDGDLFDDKDCVWKTFFSDAPGWHDVVSRYGLYLSLSVSGVPNSMSTTVSLSQQYS